MNIMTSNGVVHHMDRKIKVIIWLLLGAASLGLLALMVNNFQKPAARSNKLHVAASFYPLYFFSSQIGGEKARVINITPAGAEPHDYEPTAQDIAQIERSKLLILNGGGFEAWGDSIKQNLNAGNTLILTVGEGLTHLQAKEERESTTDPHVGAKTLVLNPIEGLSDKEASQGKTYFSEMRNNLANLRAALQCK
jgi:zinc transport system substrate-binding protein